MGKLIPLIILLELLYVFSADSLSQEALPESKRIPRSRPDTNNALSAGFDKSLNTYHWTGGISYKESFGPLNVRLEEQFLSTFIRTDRKLITDIQSVDFRLRYRLGERISAASYVKSFVLSDNRDIGGGIGRASSHGFYGGISYKPFDIFTIEPLMGVRFDNQVDQHDHGPSYYLTVESDFFRSHGYISRVSGNFQYDKIDPRVLETYNATVAVEKYFLEQARNLLRFNYYRNRRDFYIPADSALSRQYNIFYNIETRADNAFSAGDTIEYMSGKNMKWIFQGNIFSREITRTMRYKNPDRPVRSNLNSVINELKIEGSVNGSYRFSPDFRSSLTFFYLEKDEKHGLGTEGYADEPVAISLEALEKRKNNRSQRTSLISATDWTISPSHAISLSGSANILRYNTPSDDNDDDRDELWYLFSVSTSHRINRHTDVQIAFDANLSHTVYLFASRSADNNWNRTIRLMPRIGYRPWNELATTNIFEVLANYTAYDFEFASNMPRSYVFRQFAFIDSTTFTVTRRLGFEWLSHIRLYERGELRWDAFSERPINYFEEKTYLGTIRYNFTGGLLFSLGIRYFSQLRFGYAGAERKIENFLKSIGPTTGIELKMKKETALSIRGRYERQTQTNQSDRGFTTMIMTLNHQF